MPLSDDASTDYSSNLNIELDIMILIFPRKFLSDNV